jgi:uncharacterized protein (DUF433 family)
MNTQDLLKRITVESDKLSGKPCVRGHRITVANVLGLLSQGAGYEEIFEDFPFLEMDDIYACLAYASRQVDHPKVQLAAE